MTRQNGFIAGLLAGALVGAAAGIILAPKPGKETRGLLGTRATEIRSKAGYYVENLRERFKKDPVEAIEEHSENGTQTSS